MAVLHSTPTFERFAADARAQGFDEVVERKWAPATVLESHRHPFHAKALVVQGEMWLMVGESEKHLRAGDWFEVEKDVAHEERYGAEGATYWVARRN